MSEFTPAPQRGVLPALPYYAQPLLPAQPKPIAPWVWIGSVVVVMVLAATLFFGVKAYRGATVQYKQLVSPLHTKMIARDVDGIFAESDPEYQTQVGAAKSKQLFDLVHDRLGDPGETSMVSFNANVGAKEGERLFLVFTTEFANGIVTETFVFHQVDGKYRLRGYEAQSPLLTKDEMSQGVWVTR